MLAVMMRLPQLLLLPAEPLDRPAEALLQRDLGLDFQDRPHAGVVRVAARDVLVVVPVDLLLLDEPDLRAGAGEDAEHRLGELENARLAVDADVEDAAARLRRHPRADERR